MALASIALRAPNALQKAEWRELGVTIVTAGLLSAPAIPVGLIVQAFAPPQIAGVCTKTGPETGIFIGDGADRTIIESADQLLAISNDEVLRIRIARVDPASTLGETRKTLKDAMSCPSGY